jgi:hypothetical protein
MSTELKNLDGSQFSRKTKYAFGFGAEAGLDFEHCLTFKNGKMLDNSSSGFGCCDPSQMIQSRPYKLIGNKVLLQNKKDLEKWDEGFVLEGNSLKSLGNNGILVKGIVLKKNK